MKITFCIFLGFVLALSSATMPDPFEKTAKTFLQEVERNTVEQHLTCENYEEKYCQPLTQNLEETPNEQNEALFQMCKIFTGAYLCDNVRKPEDMRPYIKTLDKILEELRIKNESQSNANN